MHIITNLKDWQNIRHNLLSNVAIGFVPTMGCLHQGHASLIKKSIAENTITVLSIFVNPTQFNDPSDYEHYPKTLDDDVELARQLGVDYVIILSLDAIYPDNNTIRIITDHPIAMIMEGACRPGHFNGMLTIVLKLLLLVRAHHANFGEKDYQQYVLVSHLVRQYLIPTKVIPCPIIRELSGLPLSSRNRRLTEDQRALIDKFYRFLFSSKHELDDIKHELARLTIDYDYLETHENRLFLALKIGAIRIIDNIHEKATEDGSPGEYPEDDGEED